MVMQARKVIAFPLVSATISGAVGLLSTWVIMRTADWLPSASIEALARHLSGLKRALDPLERNDCDPAIRLAVAVSGVVAFAWCVAIVVVGMIAGLAYARSLQVKDGSPSPYAPLSLAKGTIYLAVAGFLFWYTWFFAGIAAHDRTIDCGALNGAAYFVAKPWAIATLAQYLFLAALGCLLRVGHKLVHV
jgi:hypothetical protein